MPDQRPTKSDSDLSYLYGSNLSEHCRTDRNKTDIPELYYMTDGGVCVVTHPLSSAGENATRTLLDILAELGPVSLITADLPPKSSMRDEREIVEFTTKSAGDTIPVAALRFFQNQVRMCVEIYRRPEPTVLFFGATSYLLPIMFARVIGKRVFVEPRGDVPLTLRLNWERRVPDIVAGALAGVVRALERVGFAVSDRVVTYTPSMARELDLDPDKPSVFPYGARYVDTEVFSIQTSIDERDDVIGFVGRLDEEKGIRELATVAKRLPDHLTFRFVGDGPLYDWLKRELSEEIRTGNVELTGWVDHAEIPNELNRMKLLVMPSHPTEGLPTTILESLACGTPVYATPVSGIPDVVKHGETGFLMESRQSGEIISVITKSFRDEQLLELSRNGRSLIEDRYSFEAAVRRYERLFEGP